MFTHAFSALTLLVGQQEGHLACKKNWAVECFQLMPLPLTVSCFSEIQIGFTFLVPDKGPLNGCVCMMCPHAFSALTLLVGHQEEHVACKKLVMRCWCGCLSGARCRLFAYCPADATAIPKPHHLLPCLNPDCLTFLVMAYPGCPGKKAIWRVQ